MAQFTMGSFIRWSSSMRQSVTSQTRSYASKSAIPTFAPTSSPELDQLLNRFRQDRFIPSGLPNQQRRNTFKEKHKQRLEEEPITVAISETEDFTLRPMTINELPTKSDAYEVLRLIAVNNEWKALVPFLSGLYMSNLRLSNNRLEQLVRKASDAGKLPIIMECIRQSHRTGFYLRDLGVVKRLFFDIHVLAQNGDFKGVAVTKALNMAKQAVDLMNQYAATHSSSVKADIPQNQPFVIGTLLELSAARAISDFGGKDQANEVLSYARKLVAAWPIFQEQSKKAVADDFPSARARAQETLAVYNGLRLSLSIHGLALDKELHASVTQCLAEAKSELEKVSGALERSPIEELVLSILKG
ncbi:uncharacterized protein N7482_003026 [Penicillium canariense]|uniref:Uncharacterized protein n=1 Tax=Penicillium canariense TaxID=189055 RepID=A0A9W9IIU8_9EURO|nr:uncharacterized protein N7482_003026 [Penicillium canariense]KAJ5177149.1 hypothetical protein N7482_003026 [Penicillium canariense]